jgi:hypothetical protein
MMVFAIFFLVIIHMGHRKMKPITASGWIDPQLWEKVKGIHLYSLAKRNHIGRSTSMFHLYIIKATKPFAVVTCISTTVQYQQYKISKPSQARRGSSRAT